MSKAIRPDRTLLTKNIFVLLIVTGFILILVSIVHLIIYLAGGNPNASKIVWLVSLITIIVILVFLLRANSFLESIVTPDNWLSQSSIALCKKTSWKSNLNVSLGLRCQFCWLPNSGLPRKEWICDSIYAQLWNAGVQPQKRWPQNASRTRKMLLLR